MTGTKQRDFERLTTKDIGINDGDEESQTYDFP